MKRIAIIASAISMIGLLGRSQATILNVTGPPSTLGTSAAIIAAPASAEDDFPGAENTGQQGFDEAQNVLLTAPLMVDFPGYPGGSSIAAGTIVNSHMIFLNTPGFTSASHFGVQWTFANPIIGVIAAADGANEFASSPILGAPGTIYPTAASITPPGIRGLESFGNPTISEGLGLISPNTLEVGMSVQEPGDWIRVITVVPEPSTMLLFGIGLVGMFGYGLQRRKRLS